MRLARLPSARSLLALRRRIWPSRVASSQIQPVETEKRLEGVSRPGVSRRIRQTQPPTVVMTRKYLDGVSDALSLGQGIVYWTPPAAAVQSAVAAAQTDPAVSNYGPDEGLPALRERLREKLAAENGLKEYDVMMTSGANQAFTNCLLTLCDQGDGVVLFKPYYFNHAMALQMTGQGARLIEGRSDPNTFEPDLDWLEERFGQPDPPQMVVIVNPSNPTGVVLSRETLQRAADVCERNGAWLIMDNAYEYFVYEGNKHHCVSGPHIVHIFSFSKSYGMMGWRVGYIAYPRFDGDSDVELELVKVQDTIAVCASQIGQRLALACLDVGPDWVPNLVRSLEGHRAATLNALSPLGSPGDGIYGGQGALYLWARLPEGCEDDDRVVQWLVRKHGVCVIPGSPCGSPGYIRVAFANQPYDKCARACRRLEAGLTELQTHGAAALLSNR